MSLVQEEWHNCAAIELVSVCLSVFPQVVQQGVYFAGPTRQTEHAGGGQARVQPQGRS